MLQLVRSSVSVASSSSIGASTRAMSVHPSRQRTTAELAPPSGETVCTPSLRPSQLGCASAGGGGDGFGGGGDGFDGGGDGGDAGSFQTSMVRYVAPCGVTSVYVWAVGDAQNHRTLSGDDHCRYTDHDDDEQPQVAASQSGWQSAMDGSVGASSMHDVAMHELESATKSAARIEAAGVRNCKVWNLFRDHEV